MNKTRCFLFSARYSNIIRINMQVRDKNIYKIFVIFMIFLFFSTPLISGAVADEDYNKGYQAYQGQRYNAAIKYFERAAEILKMYKDRNNKKDYAIVLNNLGAAHTALSHYDKALYYYNEALVINEELGEEYQIANQLVNISKIYYKWGQYDKAFINSKKALDIFNEQGKKEGAITCLNNIGHIYSYWNLNDEAMESYKKALVLSEELKKYDVIAASLKNIGEMYYFSGEYDKAMDNYNKALAIFQMLNDKDQIGQGIHMIGRIYYQWGQYDKALENYKKSFAAFQKLGLRSLMAKAIEDRGLVYLKLGQYDKALKDFEEALSVFQELGEKWDSAGASFRIGFVYYDQNKFNDAIEFFARTIKHIEEIRTTATGETRREFFASMRTIYGFLISSYIRNKAPEAAFNTVEASSARYLMDQLGEKLNEKMAHFTDIKESQKNLNAGTAIISYSNIHAFEKNTSDFKTKIGMAQIFVDKTTINAREVDDAVFTKPMQNKYTPVINSANEKLRGLTIEVKKNQTREDKTADDFIKIVGYYRYLLSRPDLSGSEKENLKQIGIGLYDLLLGGFKKQLEGKSDLIIIPGGILAFIPFETLVMPDGRYLAEKYNIKYTQSLMVLEMLNKRKYDENRKSLIAFGGAVYDDMSYKGDMITSEKQLAYLKQTTLSALNRGESMRNAFNALGYGKWDNLPGTLTEVKAIEKIVQDAAINTDSAVDEAYIKKLSTEGTLKRYKVVHFATHGMVVPEFPKLSSLVLSLQKQEINGEDGYLRMDEIAALDFNADFICLSSCDTALGKIYRGEGVVGLTQSFLVAGANGLSVSLWKVADNSTTEFMVGMYKKVSENGMSYDKAITEMKREYIKSGKYSTPFYWAPFVYYGK